MELGDQRHALAAMPPGKKPGIHCIGGWVGPRPGLDGYEKSNPPPTRIRSPVRPAPNESLYRLRYPGPRRGFYSFGKILHPLRGVHSNG